MMVRTLAFAVAAIVAVAAPAADFFVRGSVDERLASAYMSRGRIGSTHLNWAQDIGVNLGFEGYGYLLLGLWSYSDLEPTYRDKRGMAFSENDPAVGYGYNWKFSDGWSLDSKAFYQWDLLFGNRSGTRYCHEWIWRETFNTPWISLFSLVRAMRMPYVDWSLRLGVFKSIPLGAGFSVTPRVFMDGGRACWNERRFGGYDEDHDNFHCGPNSLTGELQLNYQLTKSIRLYAAVCQFWSVSRAVRRNVDANPSVTSRPEITYGHTGFTFSF